MFKFLNICVVVVVFTSTVVALASANCCFPDQWTANLVETTGEYNRDLDAASLAYGNRQFYFDYTGKQIAYLESLDNRTAHVKTQTKTIIKYNEGKKYTIISQKCKTEDISSTMESPCIPDDATLFGAHSYPAGVMAEVWFVPDKVNGGSKRISVTKDDCLPLSESRITGGPDYVMRMSLYQNVTKGITDPTAFNIPASCNQLLATDDVLHFRNSADRY
ncbi:uncharacterized protein LOC123537623 [Mercenaria mercenaria]|uniref:uncharacterized protein LOC123537623 n=1 Tax=Mercenaria mercenaria TaxID=6596 RepID=UPI00234F9A45|nr:uncharacterized protein LOC123537623 [Mercenaria mercenaria]